jgi:DNA-binding NarL/FixJ family response regulator
MQAEDANERGHREPISGIRPAVDTVDTRPFATWVDGIWAVVAMRDHELSERYGRWLTEAGARVASVESASDAVALVEARADVFRVVVVEATAEDGGGVDLAELIAQRDPTCHTVVVSESECETLLRNVRQIPQASFLSTHASRADFLVLVRERCLKPRIDVASWLGRLSEAYGLSPQQRRLIWLNLWGYSDDEIAGALGIKRHTVQDYQLALRRKTGVRSKASYLRLLLESAGVRAPL